MPLFARVKTFSLFYVPIAVFLAACGGTGPSANAPEGASSPEAMNKAKCGGCHSPFDPGVHTKSELEGILKKHKDEKRAKLSDEDWTKLTEYLAKR